MFVKYHVDEQIFLTLRMMRRMRTMVVTQMDDVLHVFVFWIV
jgi:hypothetical protein